MLSPTHFVMHRERAITGMSLPPPRPTKLQSKTEKPVLCSTYRLGSRYRMIEIDTSEFRGDRDRLTRLLQERYKGPVELQRNRIRLGSSDQAEASLGPQDAKDLVKRALHHMGADSYRVVAAGGEVVIRERKHHEPRTRRKGSVPSVRESVPYFFPG